MKTKEEIREYYNDAYANRRYGGVPVEDRHHTGGFPVTSMEPYYRFTKDDVVLEIGCGEGIHMEATAAVVGHVHGVDISDVAIESARKFLRDVPNCSLHVNDNIEFFPDEFFDFIWAVTVFQHMLKDHVREYLDQSFRKLKPNRYVYFQYVNTGRDERDAPGLENQSSWVPETFDAELMHVGFEPICTQEIIVRDTAKSKVVVYYVTARKNKA